MNSRALDELLPRLPEEELTDRMLALRDALGARILGIARCLHASPSESARLVFRVLQVVDQNGAAKSKETALPLGGYRRLFLGARSIAIRRDSDAPLARWLRRHGGAGLVGWPFPGDRIPCVAFLACVDEKWRPGELRLRVAREGMEALARCVGPPVWLLRSQVAPRDGPKAQEPARGLSPQEIARREAELIRRALRQARGNKTRAARALHLSRQVFYQKLKLHGILGEE